MNEREREEASLAHERTLQSQVLMSEATAQAGTVVIRTLVLVNGGAVIAMLAFMANLVSSKQPDAFDGVIDALSLFSLGVFTAVVTAGFTYFSNYSSAISVGERSVNWEYPYIRETSSSIRWSRVSNALNVATVILGLASAGFFLAGIVSLKDSMLTIL